jgi:hypothetical protein
MKHDLNNKRHMMTRNDIQETYGITKHLYQSLVNNKVINTVKIGKHNYHPMEEVDKAIKELEERKSLRVTYYTGSRKQNA